MKREIKRTEEGVLTDEQAQQFMLQVSQVTVQAFQKLGQLTPEELLATFQAKEGQPETYLAVVNSVFQDVVEADMPQGFNDYIQNVGMTVLEKTFNTVAQKNNDNIAALLKHVTGVEYNDLSPKDVIATITQIEAEIVPTEG